MQFGLSDTQAEVQARFRRFCDDDLAPCADAWDRTAALPRQLIDRLATAGWLVSTLPQAAGGAAHDNMTHGLLVEEVGRGCQSTRNLLAVQGMVAHAIFRWGPPHLRDTWPARIAGGQAVAAFALTEPEGGSDARRIRTRASKSGSAIVLNGRKKWISFATLAQLVLVIAEYEGAVAAIAVEAGTPGMTVAPIDGMLGLRASHVGEIVLSECEVPAANLVVRGPLVFETVVTGALDYGRFSTACGCVGLAQACLSAALRYARERGDGDQRLDCHQLVRAKLSDMIVRTEAARLLCRRAAWLRDQKHPDAVTATLEAKYFASTAAYAIAGDAVQIHGAAGCGPDCPVQRHLRDAKIQEIIEGATELQQSEIARLATR